MTEIPIHDPQAAQKLADEMIAARRRARRQKAIFAILLMFLGGMALAVGASFIAGTIWVGVTILGGEAVLVGLLLGRDS